MPRIGGVPYGVAFMLESEARRVGCVMRGGEGSHRDACDSELVTRFERVEGEAGELLLGGGGAGAGIELPVEVLGPDLDPRYVVGVLVGEDEGANVVLIQPQGAHAHERLPAGQPAIDHDEAVRALD